MRLIFRNPKFRLLWLSNTFNEMGVILFLTVHGFLALTVTDSPFWTGATAGMGGVAVVLFGAFGGVMADRLERRWLVMGTQLGQAAIVSLMAALVFMDAVQLWHILAAAFFNGLLVALKAPSRIALTLDVAGRRDMLSATGANFASMTAMGVLAPLLGGQIGSRFDIGWTYAIMTVAFISAAMLMALLSGIPRIAASTESPWHDLRSGVRYVFTTPPVRMLILMALIGEAFGWAHETMLPVMARDVLGVGLDGLGYLLSVANAGALASALVLSNLGDVQNKSRLLVGGYAGFGIFLVLFAMSRLFPLSLVLLALAYGSVMVYETALHTVVQTTVPDGMRGRVVSFQIMTWGVTGASGFHMGGIAALLGAPVAIAVGGGVVVLNALRVLRRIGQHRTQPTEQPAGD